MGQIEEMKKINLKEPPEFKKECYLKQQQMELVGDFNSDVNENPTEAPVKVDETFDFYRKGFRNAIKKAFYLTCLKIYSAKINRQLKTKVVGKKNWKGLKSAIITSNHVSLFDSFAIRKATGFNIKYVAAYYNNWDGVMGEVSRHTGYMPLKPFDLKFMRKFNDAVEHFLNKGKKILIYPEQAMWRDYKKPRPMKNGAFHYAAKHNVPIAPIFITMREGTTEAGAEYPYFTINMLPPIYPKKDLTIKENVEFLRKENYRLWKECYETIYGVTLQYTTQNKDKIII